MNISSGRPLLDDAPAIHEDDAVGDLAGKAHLVSDDDHGDAGLGQLLHHVEHLADHLRVERRGRLVEQQHLRLHGQRPGDADALLLPAGKLRRIFVDVVLEPDADQKPPGRARPRRPRSGRARATGAERHVAQYGHMRKQVEALEHHADLGARRRACDRGRPRVPSTTMVAAVVLLELVDAADQGRLA